MALLIRAGALLDCTGGELVHNVEVLVEGDRISSISVGTTASDRGQNIPLIDAPGLTLMPGMIDLHNHVFQWGQRWRTRTSGTSEEEPILETALRGIRNAEKLLHLGVTTMRDVKARDDLNIQLRDMIRSGQIPGPRTYATGTQIRASGRVDNFFAGIGVCGVDEARAAARRQLRAGADWIKLIGGSGVGGGFGKLVGPTGWQELSEEEMRVVCEEAHRPGIKVAVHANSLDTVKAALRAGADTIEHGLYLDDEAIDMMLQRDVPLVTTQRRIRDLYERGAQMGFPQNVMDGARLGMEAGLKSLAKAHRAGVRVATGSDSADESIPAEIREYVIAGLTPMEAIRAATSVAAGVLDLSHELGTVETGMIADLILTDGNPLDDLEALTRVTHVIHDGVLVKGSLGISSAATRTAAAMVAA